jgi:hypothetical protein
VGLAAKFDALGFGVGPAAVRSKMRRRSSFASASERIPARPLYRIRRLLDEGLNLHLAHLPDDHRSLTRAPGSI